MYNFIFESIQPEKGEQHYSHITNKQQIYIFKMCKKRATYLNTGPLSPVLTTTKNRNVVPPTTFLFNCLFKTCGSNVFSTYLKNNQMWSPEWSSATKMAAACRRMLFVSFFPLKTCIQSSFSLPPMRVFSFTHDIPQPSLCLICLSAAASLWPHCSTGSSGLAY